MRFGCAFQAELFGHDQCWILNKIIGRQFRNTENIWSKNNLKNHLHWTKALMNLKWMKKAFFNHFPKIRSAPLRSNPNHTNDDGELFRTKFHLYLYKEIRQFSQEMLLILFSQKICSHIIFLKQNSSKQKSTSCLNTETTQARNWSQDPFARLHASKKTTSNRTGTDSRRGQRCYQIHTDRSRRGASEYIDVEQQTEDFTLNLLPSRWAGFCLTVFAPARDSRFFHSLSGSCSRRWCDV